MLNRAAFFAGAWLLAAAVSWAASVERAQELYLSGDLDGARGELHELLADTDAAQRAPALKLLGRIEVDRENWQAALDAWSELADRHALSAEATAIMPALRPLQALVECGCETPPGPGAIVAEATEPTPSAPPPAEPAPARALPTSPTTGATEPTEPTPGSAPARPAPEPSEGLLVIGAWGAEYDAALEVTAALTEFLEANGVAVRPASTEIPAIHGADTVLAYLLEEARESGADGVLFLTSRFAFREFIQVQRYDSAGREIWSDRVVGGTALKQRRFRDQPNWKLVDRFKKRLSKRLGTPDLPTG